MSLADDINSMYQHTAEAYGAIEAGGGAFTGEKNLANLATAIGTIKVILPYDPANPQLSDIKAVLNSDDPTSIYPIGTEIPDTYDGESNPWIVAHYGMAIDANDNNLTGVFLFRKFATTDKVAYSSPSLSVSYDKSELRAYINNEYRNKCSQELLDVITAVKFQVRLAGTAQVITDSLYPMSGANVYCFTGDPNEYHDSSTYGDIGHKWDYWGNSLNLTNMQSMGTPAPGRSEYSDSYWLRSAGTSLGYGTSVVKGAVDSIALYYMYKVLPACFISKN